MRCTCHHRDYEQLKAELEAMDPIFDALLWLAHLLIPKRVRTGMKSGVGTESLGPN